MVRTMFELRNPVSAEFLALLFRETEGNPFFVEEVLKSLVEEGAIYRVDGGWERKKIDEIDVPRSIKEVVGRRLERISEASQHVLSHAAIIGRRFRFEILQAIGEMGEEDLLGALEEAMRAQLVREESGAGEVEYDFVHALIREVLYDRLSLRRRMTLHQKVGETLERQYAGRIEAVVEDLAHHFTRAPHGVGLEKAIEYSLQAARKAMDVFAHEEAIKYYRNAAELLAESGDERRLAETNFELGEPFVYLDDPASAIGAYERALAFYERHGPAAQAALVQMRIGSAHSSQRNFAAAITHWERALLQLNPQEHGAVISRAHRYLSTAKTFMGRIEEAARHADIALSVATELGDATLRAGALHAHGLVAGWRVDIDAAITHYEETLRLAREGTGAAAFREFKTHSSLNNLAVLHEARGDHARQLSRLLEALDVARRVKDLHTIAFYLGNLFWYCHRQGDWQTARQYAATALEMPLSPLHRQVAERYMCEIEGDWEGAAVLAQQVLEYYRPTGDLQGILTTLASLARLNLDLGHLREAHDTACEAAEILETAPVYLVLSGEEAVAEALARSGEHDRCQALCARGETLSRSVKSPNGLAVALYGQGVLALEQDDAGGAVQRLEESLQVARRGGPFHARILRWLARALLRRGEPGDSDRATKILLECVALLERMGDGRRAALVRAQLAARPQSS